MFDLMSRKTLARAILATGLAAATILPLSGSAQAACQLPPGFSSSCTSGVLCIWKNDPKDSLIGHTTNALSDYRTWCWKNTSTIMDNHATIIDNNWSVSVTLYRDPGTPGTSDKRCFANGAAEENLKNVNFAGTSTVMNDKVSSHKSQNLQTFCP